MQNESYNRTYQQCREDQDKLTRSHVCEVAASTNSLLLLIVMNMPSEINTGFQLCDGSDSEGEVEDASISPMLSHAEVPESHKFSRIANDHLAFKQPKQFSTIIPALQVQ